MWNERYTSEEYIYGTDPNSFLVEHANTLLGPVLSLAEGEGRNAVFLTSLGLPVHCVDGSEVALGKARALADTRRVKIQTEVADLAVFEPQPDSYSSVISIFAHLPSSVRSRLYPRVERSLKPGGIILLEAFSEAQLHRDTGGPPDADMLMTCDKIERHFSGYEPVLLREIEREVCEGRDHTGMASVIQFIGKKRA